MNTLRNSIIAVALLIILGTSVYFLKFRTQETQNNTDTPVAESSPGAEPNAAQTSPGKRVTVIVNGKPQQVDQKNVVIDKVTGKPTIVAAPTPVEEKKQCFQITFRSSAKRVHSRELLNLPETKLNPSSVCVRVNGVPVRHQIKADKTNEILIQGLPEMADSVVVQYCEPKVQCTMPCQVKQDEFMNALSGGEENLDSDPLEMAQGWEGSAGDGDLDAEEKAFKAEVKNFKNELSGANSARAMDQLSSRWKVSENTTWCESSLKAGR